MTRQFSKDSYDSFTKFTLWYLLELFLRIYLTSQKQRVPTILHFRRPPRHSRVYINHLLDARTLIIPDSIRKPPECSQNDHSHENNRVVIHRRYCGREGVLGMSLATPQKGY